MSKITILSSATLALAALFASAPASAITYTYSAVMNAANEPGTVNAPGASGIAVVTFDTDLLSVMVNQVWVGLTSPITVNHIHCCTAMPGTGTSGVALGFSPTLTTSGSYAATFTLASTPFYNLLQGASAGLAYVNVHTGNNPGGEIRGFLTGPTMPIPEPGTWALMLGGLAAVGAMARRRSAAV